MRGILDNMETTLRARRDYGHVNTLDFDIETHRIQTERFNIDVAIVNLLNSMTMIELIQNGIVLER